MSEELCPYSGCLEKMKRAAEYRRLECEGKEHVDCELYKVSKALAYLAKWYEELREKK